MPDFAVSTTFKAHDRISAVFSRMGKAADKFGGRAEKSFNRASRSASSFGTITRSILAAGAIQRGIGLLQRGLAATTTEFIGFDQAVTSASAKFKDIDRTTKQGQRALEGLRATARKVGADTQFSAGEAASGLDFLAMAGFSAQQAMASLPGVVDVATVATVDLARATDIVSDSLGAFGLMTTDAAKLQTNLTRVNDVMALTMSRTNTSMEALFEAVQKGAPTFTSTGQSMESFGALIGVMANSGVKGAEAGTQLRNVMLRLANPTAQAQKLLKTLNVTTRDSQGNFLDVVDIVGQFEKGLKGMGTQQRAAALSTIFGARAVTGINLLLQEGSKNIASFRSELEKSGGASQSMANIMRMSLQNRLKSLQSAAIELGFKFITAFEKQGGSAIDRLTEAVRSFNPTPIIEGIKIAASAIATLWNIIKPFGPYMPILIGGFVTYGVALKGLALVSAIANFGKLVTAAHAMAGAMGVVNVVMAANPLGLFIAGLTAVIALVVYLEKRFNFLSNIFDYWSTKYNQLKELLGFSEEQTTAPRRSAPNREEVEARQQNIGFNGQLNIAGAPEGSTFESKTTGAPPIRTNMLGANQ